MTGGVPTIEVSEGLAEMLGLKDVEAQASRAGGRTRLFIAEGRCMLRPGRRPQLAVGGRLAGCVRRLSCSLSLLHSSLSLCLSSLLQMAAIDEGRGYLAGMPALDGPGLQHWCRAIHEQAGLTNGGCLLGACLRSLAAQCSRPPSQQQQQG